MTAAPLNDQSIVLEGVLCNVCLCVSEKIKPLPLLREQDQNHVLHAWIVTGVIRCKVVLKTQNKKSAQWKETLLLAVCNICAAVPTALS